jgi:1-acyl-sn-glycerol-3-phosphate acyltransferase
MVRPQPGYSENEEAMNADAIYEPVVTRLPEALQEEAEAIAEAEAAQRKAEADKAAQAVQAADAAEAERAAAGGEGLRRG